LALPTPHDPSEDESSRRQQRDYVRYSTIGIEFALVVGVFGFAGWWLDGKLGLADTFPVFLLLGVFLGMSLGIYRMNRTLGGSRKGRSDRGDPGSQA
jgi:F0F1-type ATP synthase assembly protein I